MKLEELLLEATDLQAEIDQFRPFNPELENKIWQKFRLDWNFHSNHLEGNQLTYGETKALILFNITASGKPLQDHLEITGHNEALLEILEVVRTERPLTEAFIRSLHQIILVQNQKKKAQTPDGQLVFREIKVGQYKSAPNHVLTQTGEMFYFASPEETPALMEELIKWYKEKLQSKDINPIIFATEFHDKFIRIHPFDDGNGRMARILMNFILIQFGYPPAIVKTTEKEAYFNVLKQADAGNIEPFVSFICQHVINSQKLILKAMHGESIEDQDDIDKQFALLEHHLKLIETIQYRFNEEIFERWKAEIFPVILSAWIKMCEKFESFYVESKYFFSENDLTFDKNKLLDLKYNSKFFLYCHFSTFKKPDIDLNYSHKLTIIFEETKYHVKTENQTLSKLYHQIPSEQELKSFFDLSAKEHLNLINQKLNIL